MKPAAKPKAPWVELAARGRAMMPNGGLKIKREPMHAQIRRRTRTRAAQERIYNQRARLFLLRNKWCAVFDFSGSREMATEVHHSRGRIQKLLLEERWWIPVSAIGHSWIGKHPTLARKIRWNGIPVLCKIGDWGRSEP